MKTVLFLDVDGVLNCVRGEFALSDTALSHLAYLVSRLGCDIVITSSWRLYADSLTLLRQAFELHGIPAWIGVTPDSCGPRWAEILAWVFDHLDADSLVIIVDDDDDADPRHHAPLPVPCLFFQADPAIGLNRQMTRRILDACGA